jgi:hypothetical protein
MKERIEDLTILLLYLTGWNEEEFIYDENDVLSKTTFKRSWKGHSFDALNALTEKELLYPSKNKTKSVCLTKEGEDYAKSVYKEYFGEEL